MDNKSLEQGTTDDREDEGYVEENRHRLRKRIRLSSYTNANRSPYVYKRTYRRKNPIMHLPTEIMYKIFSLMTNEELGWSPAKLVVRIF